MTHAEEAEYLMRRADSLYQTSASQNGREASATIDTANRLMTKAGVHASLAVVDAVNNAGRKSWA